MIRAFLRRGPGAAEALIGETLPSRRNAAKARSGSNDRLIRGRPARAQFFFCSRSLPLAAAHQSPVVSPAILLHRIFRKQQPF